MRKRKNSFYTYFIKRILDIIFSIIGLIVLLVPMLVIALIVRVRLGTPVLFVQERPGKNAKLFKMYKFRTMIDECDANSNLLSDEKRLTKFGKFLRSTSMDELPELINILKGEMSFVGPRPLLQQYLRIYTPEQATRHDVRPGLTGLSQVSGRNAMSWQEKFQYDVQYVSNVSFWQDLKIFFLTVKVVFLCEGISDGKCATAEFFNGKN